MRSRFLAIIITSVYIIIFTAFYFKYVPRIPIFFLILSSLTVFFVVSTAISPKFGTLGIVCLIPIISSLPYFFNTRGIHPLLIVFLGYVLGIFIHYILHPVRLKWSSHIFLPICGASIIVLVSSVITVWRYSNFFPVFDTSIHELTVNAINIKAGEAIRRVLFDSVNYLAGFIWFGIIIKVLSTKKLVKKAILLLSISTSISLLFGLYQFTKDSSLGNLDFFVELNRINALFSDPNAFGVYLVLILPLFLGAISTLKIKQKFVLLFPIILGIFLLPHIGSRSGFLGAILAVVFFLIAIVKGIIGPLSHNHKFYRKALAYSFLIIFIVAIISVLLISSKESTLYKRLDWNIKIFSKKDVQERILMGRHYFWKSAYYMIKELPLSGIGIGAYMIELPNYYQKYNIFPVKPPSYYTRASAHEVLIDTAGSYYLQVGAELGVIGLFFLGWIFYLILKRMYHSNVTRKILSDWNYLIAGVSAGIFSVIIIFLLGAHVLNFEIQMTFWLAVGFLFVLTSSNGKEINLDLKRKILFGSIIFLFTISHLWNSTHSLSFQRRTLDFDMNQSFGLYQEEKMDGQQFRWSEKNAGIQVELKKTIISIPVFASHPDIQEKPVKVKIYFTQNLFKDSKLLIEIVLKESKWQEVELNLSDEIGARGLVVFKTSRTWQPLKVMGVPDPRNLGIAIGEIKFKGSSSLYEKKVMADAMILSRFSRSDWQGERRGNLFNNKSKCWLDLSLPAGNIMFKISARGQMAKDEWPYMVVWLNNDMIGGNWITSENWKYYTFQKDVEGGEYKISIEFVNDYYDRQTRADRNLYIGDLEVIK